MMRRAVALRPHIEEVVGEQELDGQRGRRNRNIQNMSNCLQDSQLIANDWKVIELLIDALQDFEDILLRLEGEGQLRCERKAELTLPATFWRSYQLTNSC
jgi:hypothetical protein